MGNYYSKQPSSRPIVFQALAYTGNATSVPSTNFAPTTAQIRVCSEVQGWLAFGPGSVSGTTLACVVASSSLKIQGNVDEEYFAVGFGMMAAFNSTSTSSGMVSICEMA
jgi:hypothetical protein